MDGGSRGGSASLGQTLSDLDLLPAEGWLGDPIEVNDPGDIETVELIRQRNFGRSLEKRTQHLGEAQTCHIIATWAAFTGSVWISDDHDSLVFAEVRGITAWNTLDVMRAIVADGDLTDQQAYDLMLDMADADRGVELPESPRDLLK